MRWTIRKGRFPPNLPDNEKFMFEEIDLKHNDGDEELKAELEKLGYGEWITYPIEEKSVYTEVELQAMYLYDILPNKNIPELKSQVSKRKYEIFCGGFLFYHDVVFKKYPKGKGDPGIDYPDGKVYPDNKFGHRIFFEWFKGKGVNNDQVRIYINDTPEAYNVDPPPPPPPPPPES